MALTLAMSMMTRHATKEINTYSWSNGFVCRLDSIVVRIIFDGGNGTVATSAARYALWSDSGSKIDPIETSDRII